MPLRDAYPRPRLMDRHYYFSIAHGEELRTYALRPAVLWTLIALLPLLVLWGAGASVFIACHDGMLGALLVRQAEMQYSYEDRLAEARAELDRVTSRQLLDQTSFEGKVHELLSRQAQLEQRTSIVASMAQQAEARPSAVAALDRTKSKTALAGGKPAGALAAIQALGAPSDSDGGALDSVSSFAPIASSPSESAKPRPIEEPRAPAREHTSALAPDPDRRAQAELSQAVADAGVPAETRLNLIAASLDRMERGQMATLAKIGHAAGTTAARLREAIEATGISPDRFAEAPKLTKAGVGGPYIPLTADANAPAFDKEVAKVERTILAEDHLRAVVPFMPLRRPLFGEAGVSSPFGYRPDPFLGRPALHPGIDLVQEYGAEVKSTGAGRVTHAGPMGGYGNMVEIDHGNGLTTRYGHLSEVLVEEGQQVKANEVVGRIGSTGRSTGPHLHYEVRIDGEPVDPARFLKAGGLLLASE
ncbi:MAG TPA: peptidoglycan DD-metalloendopeptidase family protein [Roseiarcus sp.]|nr:peptidoglycan DD-metalloendopeptidase family protein [Roseiarcus sp.]